jgi:uncharacterized protein involved in exopolysaccharide biosynthesis
MEINTKGLEIEEDNFFNEFMFRFFPYWPLFTVLFVSALILAFGYLLWSNPTWSISATVLIKDEKQGVDNPSILQATDISNSTNIVENEMQVFNSRTLLRQAVMKLNLYAPIYSDQPVLRLCLPILYRLLLSGKRYSSFGYCNQRAENVL